VAEPVVVVLFLVAGLRFFDLFTKERLLTMVKTVGGLGSMYVM